MFENGQQQVFMVLSEVLIIKRGISIEIFDRRCLIQMDRIRTQILLVHLVNLF